MDRYLRVFRFAAEVFAMGTKNRILFMPMLANVAFAAPVNMGLAIAASLVESSAGAYSLMSVGITALYFIDYFSNSLTASLIYDQVTTGRADIETALSRTRKVVGSIALFAGISAFFDMLQAYANERNDIVSRVLTRVLYSIWTTATYVCMPAMVLEGTSFGAAFTRSKDLAKNDPTQVGVGIIGVGVVNYALGAVIFSLAYKLYALVGGMLGAALFYTLINVYWAVSGFLKISYFTCFYMWARECEQKRSSSPALAPAPLAAAMA
jgi:hypothetical protein